jgi:hypothetical protein
MTCIVIFLALIFAFYVVSRAGPVALPKRTFADVQNKKTLERWVDNVAGSARNHQQSPSDNYLPLYTPRPPSTLSGTTIGEGDLPEYAPLPSQPAATYFFNGRVETNDILSVERGRVI